MSDKSDHLEVFKNDDLSSIYNQTQQMAPTGLPASSGFLGNTEPLSREISEDTFQIPAEDEQED